MSPPFLTSSIVSADSVAVGSPAQVPCLVACSPVSNSTGNTFRFDPGDQVTDVLGEGLSAQSILYLLRSTGVPVCAAVAAASWTAAPSVAHKDANGGNSPTGAAITVALDSGIPGCLDDMNIVVTPTSSGANGVASIDITYDNGAAQETITVPVEGSAVLTGTVDIGAFTYPYSALHTKHLDFTSPAAEVITWSASTVASAQGIVDAFNTAAIAAPLAVRARLKYGTGTDLGKVFFELYSTGTGAGVTVTIDDAASDADTVLGFASGSSNLTTTGTAAKYPLPAAGLVLTFANGSYVKNETYLIPTVGPRPSGLQAVVDAATAAHDAFDDIGGFGFIAVPFPAPDAGACKSLVDELETLRLTWLSDVRPRDIYFCVGGPWHTASAMKATNKANITSNDQATQTAFATAAKNPNSVAHDDVYIPGSVGTFRRSAALTWAQKRAAAPRLAATVTEGSIPQASLVAPDGLTLARDANTATVKLGGLDGPGFFVLNTLSDGSSVGFDLGATRAGKTSRLRHDGDVAVCHETARLMQDVVLDVTSGWKGQRPEVDTSTGMATDAAKASKASQMRAKLEPTLQPKNGEPNVSDFNVVVSDPVTGKFTDNGQMPVKATLVVLGTIQAVTITVAAAGTSPAATTISP